MAFAPALRRFTFTTHVTSSVGWVGAVLVFLALAAIGLTSQDETTVRGAYLLMAPAAWFVLVPLAHAALVSGIALSLGEALGGRRQMRLSGTLNGKPFTGATMLVRDGGFCIGVTKAALSAAGAADGDTVTLSLTPVSKQ